MPTDHPHPPILPAAAVAAIDVAAMKPDPSAPAFRCAACEDTGLVHFRESEKGPRLARECTDCPTYHEGFIAQFGPSSGIPPRILANPPGFQAFVPRRGTKDDTLRTFCERYVAGFTRESHGIVFYGEPGTGKSFAAATIAASLLHRRFKPKFWDVPDLMAEIKSTFNDGGHDQSEWSIITDAREADLLVLDDIGSEKSSEFVNQELFLIINGRIVAGKPTIITTNVGLNRWEAQFGPRIASRLYEVAPKGSIIAVGGSDRRKER